MLDAILARIAGLTRRRRLEFCSAFLGLASACALPGIERAHAPLGAQWQSGLPSAGHGIHTTIAVIGETPATGASPGVVEAMTAELGAARAQRQTFAAIWLGHHASQAGDPGRHGPNARDCDPDLRPWASESFGGLRRLALETIAAGGQSYALPGFNDWACDRIEALDASEVGAWQHPGFHFVIRVDGRGRSTQAFDCSTSATCKLAAATSDTRVELVFIDLSPLWIDGSRLAVSASAHQQSLRQLDDLLAAYAAMAAAQPQHPRLLITHLPAESAGRHGHGTQHSRATFLGLPATLRQLLRRGVFTGVVAGHELAHHGVRDIADGVFRSARTWLDYPVFQLVAGRSGAPSSARALWESQRIAKTSLALIPDYRSVSPGYSAIRIGDEHIELVTVIQRDDGLYHHVERVEIRPARHPNARTLPPMFACLYCDPEDGAADGARIRSRTTRRVGP